MLKRRSDISRPRRKFARLKRKRNNPKPTRGPSPASSSSKRSSSSTGGTIAISGSGSAVESAVVGVYSESNDLFEIARFSSGPGPMSSSVVYYTSEPLDGPSFVQKVLLDLSESLALQSVQRLSRCIITSSTECLLSSDSIRLCKQIDKRSDGNTLKSM